MSDVEIVREEAGNLADLAAGWCSDKARGNDSVIDATLKRHDTALSRLSGRVTELEQALAPISERPCIRGFEPGVSCQRMLPDRATWCDRCLARAAFAGSAGQEQAGSE